MSKEKEYEVDLRNIEGEGDFPCPVCGDSLSPEDESGKVYEIVDATVIGNELKAIYVVCKGCKAKTKIIGFDV